MKIQSFLQKFSIIILFSFISIVLRAETIHQWSVYTISFKSAKDYPNPYADIPSQSNGDLLHVVFEGTTGAAMGKRITLVGFWDGGREWRVNFTPPYTQRHIGDSQYILIMFGDFLCSDDFSCHFY